MKNPDAVPSLPLKQGREKSLPREAFVKLMKDVLDRGIPFRFRAAGYSMSPFIKGGDVLTINPISSHSLKTGDVVVYKKKGSGEIVVHRVVKVRHDAYLVKGDNLLDLDGMVSPGAIFGVVCAVERNDKKVRFGIKWGKWLIAFLSRLNFLTLPLHLVRKMIRLFSKDSEE